MKKKVYITPITQTFHVQMTEGVLLSLSDTTSASSSLTVESKGSGEWDIWGNGSDDDYDDEY